MRWALLCLLFFLFVSVGPFVMGQAGFGGGGPSAVSVQTGAASNPVDGQQWIRDTDLQLFTYSDSLGKWLGEEQVWEYGHTNAAYTGFLRINPRILTDTTTDAERGHLADGVIRIMEAHIRQTVAVECTTVFYSDQDVVLKLNSTAASPTHILTPTADSTAGWISPSDRVVVSDTDILSAVSVAGIGSPSFQTVKLFVREEVTP